MKITFEIQQLVAQLGIDAASFEAWKEQEMVHNADRKTVPSEKKGASVYELVI